MLAKQSKVQDWLLDAYVTLGLRPGLSLEILELYKKGIDGLTITKLFMIREGIGAQMYQEDTLTAHIVSALKRDSQRRPATSFVDKRWKGSFTFLPKSLQA